MRRLVPHVRIPGFRLSARLRACAIFYLQPHGAWAQPSHTIVRLGFTMHERVRSGLGARAQDAQLRCMQLMQAEAMKERDRIFLESRYFAFFLLL